MVRWEQRRPGVPLSQLEPTRPARGPRVAVGDWRYWVAKATSLTDADTKPKLRDGADGGRVVL